jgi:two-component system LytT family sensor kinase
MGNRLFLLTLFIAGILRHAQASDTLYIHSLAEIDSIPVMDNAAFFVDEANQLNWKEALHHPFASRPDLTSYIRSEYGKRRVSLWLRLTVNNVMPDSLRLMMLFHRYAYFRDVVMFRGKDTTYIHPNYFYTSQSKQERKNISALLKPGEGITFLVRIYNPYSNLYPREFLVTNRKAYLNARMNLYHGAYSSYMFQIMFLAIVLFITMHTLVQYFIRKRKEFIIYALYSFSVFLYFLYRLEFSLYYDILFSYFPFVYKFCNNPISILVYYTYFRFAREFVNFKALAPWFHQVIIWSERLLIAALVVDIICNTVLNNYQLREIIFTSLRILLLLVSFVGISILLRSGKKALYFIGVGSALLIIGLTLSMIFTFYPDLAPFYKNDTLRFMQFGVILELLCFTSGLSYKSHLIEVERQNMQQQLIGQLEENRRLQTELNTQLATRVKEQTEQLLAQQKQLDKEKEQQLTLEFTKKLTEIELQLLKSQLNPHFYFNTLHNLYGLAMIAPKKAPDAILRLSDIMEYVIYDCRHDKVPVTKELRFINSYIELEKLRYDDSARINLKVSGESEEKQISPMILIQFIENAFKHGLEEYKNNSYLNIKITIENGHLRYESVNSIAKTTSSSNGGVGLTNVRKRLNIIYPSKHRLHIHSDNLEYKVDLTLELN